LLPAKFCDIEKPRQAAPRSDVKDIIAEGGEFGKRRGGVSAIPITATIKR
jgi:hypothetical protein